MNHRILLQHIDSRHLTLEQLESIEPQSLHCRSLADSHRGLIRLLNEDAYLNRHQEKLWVVADGMGGHKRGDYASKAVVRALQDFKNQPSLIHTLDDLQVRLVEANQNCQQAFRATRVGSTVALMIEHAGYGLFLWAGDSRIYRFRDHQLEQMTHDHSLAQEKLERGKLNQDEANKHHTAHILTRAVGVHRSLKLELHGCPIEPGDRYLLCSDGLYGGINDDKIRETLTIKPPQQALDNLMRAALDAGGRDNITTIIVDFAAENP